MVVGANELSERLLQVNHDKLKFKFYEAEGENHASVVPTSLSKGLRFISYRKKVMDETFHNLFDM